MCALFSGIALTINASGAASPKQKQMPPLLPCLEKGLEIEEQRQDLLSWLQKVDLTPGGGHKRPGSSARVSTFSAPRKRPAPRSSVPTSARRRPDRITLAGRVMPSDVYAADAQQFSDLAMSPEMQPRAPTAPRSRPGRTFPVGSLWNPLPSLWQGGMPHAPRCPVEKTSAVTQRRHKSNVAEGRYRYPQELRKEDWTS